MIGEGTDMTILSAKELMRNESTRLEVYRLAVENGFFNEGPEAIGYKGYQIMYDGERYLVVKHGTVLIQVASLHIAKVWVTCRVSNLSLVDAYALVRTEA